MPRYRDDDLREALQKVGDKVGGPPTAEQYRTHQEQEMPTARQIINRNEGSWIAALVDAGFEVDMEAHIGGEQYSRADCLKAVRIAICHIGGRPSKREYRDLGFSPSPETIRRKTGLDWKDVTEKAYSRLSDSARTLLENGPQNVSKTNATHEPIHQYRFSIHGAEGISTIYWLPCHDDEEIIRGAVEQLPSIVDRPPRKALGLFSGLDIPAGEYLKDYYSEEEWAEAFGQ